MKPVKYVFLVDDDKLFVFLTKKTIEATNFDGNIKEFGDGREAIDYLKEIAFTQQELPDVIFLDLSMPVMDGWEFLEEYMLIDPVIRKNITLYICSSSISPHDIERAKNIGAVSDFIIKPISKEKFIEMLKD
jgi:CheY-like chemotaxis protein